MTTAPNPDLPAQLSRRGLFFKLASAAGITLLIQVAGLGFQYVSQVLIARWTGSAGEFGVYGLARSWMQVLGMTAAFGLPPTMLRYVPEYISSRDWKRLNGLLRFGRLWTLAGGTLVAAAGTIVLLCLELRISRTPLLIGLWAVPLFALTQVQVQMIRGTHRIAAAFTPTFLVQPLLAIAASAAVFWGTGALTADQSLYIVGGVLGCVFLLQELLLYRAVPAESHRAGCEQTPRTWLNVAVPLSVSAIALMILRESDILLVGMLRNSHEAGIYLAANRTARLCAFVLSAGSSLVGPMISPRFARGDIEGLRQLTRYAIHLIFWPALAVSAGIVLLSRPILGSFGEEYLAGRLPLLILLVGQLANAVTGPVSLLLSLSGHQRQSSRATVGSAVLSLVLSFALIPYLGMNGAALASTVSVAVCSGWLAVLVARHLDIVPVVFPVPWPGRTRKSSLKKTPHE